LFGDGETTVRSQLLAFLMEKWGIIETRIIA